MHIVMLSDHEKMVAKILDVMKVTRQEIRLLRVYGNMNRRIDAYLVEIQRLSQKAASL